VYVTPPPGCAMASAFGRSVAAAFAAKCAAKGSAANFDELAIFTHLASSPISHGVVAHSLHGPSRTLRDHRA